MPQAGSVNSGSFDFNSQTGVMSLLAAIRASESLTAQQRAEMRDLVFAYANGGGDATVRRNIEQKISTYGLVPVISTGLKSSVPDATPAPVPPPVRPFGKSRPAPQFSPVSVVGTITPPPVVPVTPVVEPVRVVLDTQPEPAPVTPSPVPVAPVLQPEPIPAPVAAPVVPAEPERGIAPVASEPIAVSTPSGFDPEAARQRILEIKALVNQRVGNPVNLVDIDNVVGREYMVALLEAMKRVGGGMPGDLGEAMRRLESAYAAVEAALTAHNTTPVAQAPVREENIPPRPLTPAPEPAPAFVPPAAAPVVQPEPAPVTPPPVPVAPVQQPQPEPVMPVRPDPVVAAPQVTGSLPVRPVTPVAEPAPAFRAMSLAEDATKVLTPSDLPEAAAIETSSVTGDPLYTKEVETGLAQLLLEWEIFKKSGLFGTGPRGFEHPLFKALSVMTIPAILAGKFDGSTPEIRQSVTDYMNGWRYEHGIVHSQEETFERYLRRVVRYIIDLQKRRTQA